jgi:hypothetical protein
MRLLADENFDGRILRGLQKQYPDIDIIRVQDTEIYKADDPTVLEWAAKEQRIVLTHDVSTMIGYAYDRVKANLPMLGLIEVRKGVSIGQILEDLSVLIGAGNSNDFENQIWYVPMR